MLDVAIVGGGVAGHSAAYRLRDRDIRLFEKEETVGGRARTVIVAGEPVNFGPQIAYLGTPTEDLCRELGIGFIELKPQTYSYHFNGKTVVARNDEEIVERVAMSPEGRADFRDTVATISRLYGEYAGRGLTTASDALAEISFADWLGDRHSEVAAFFDAACVAASTAFADQLSAQYAIRYVAAYLVRDDQHRSFIPAGVNEISKTLRSHLGERVETGVEVLGVERTTGGFALRIRRGRDEERTEAREVIFAVPGPEVPALMPALPEWKRRALTDVPYAAYTGMGVVVDGAAETEWDDSFITLVEGREIQTIFHQTMHHRASRSPEQKSVLSLYIHNRPAEAYLDRTDDEAQRERWLDELAAVYPGTRGRIAGTTPVFRWRHCFAYPTADRPKLLKDLAAPVEGLHFAGDYASLTAGMHGAIESGARAASEIVGGSEAGG